MTGLTLLYFFWKDSSIVTFIQTVLILTILKLLVSKGMNSGLWVAVEGNIAVGKSTLIKQVKEAWASNVSVWYETIPNDLLELFYTWPKQYSFTLQMNTLTRRAMDIQESLRASSWGHLHVFDRSILGDLVFALQHRLNGNIQPKEWIVYQQQAESIHLFERLLPSIDRIVYLFNRPSTSVKNVKKRGQVDADVPFSLLDQLSVLNDHMFLALTEVPASSCTTTRPLLPIRFVPWDHFGTLDDFEDALVMEREGRWTVVDPTKNKKEMVVVLDAEGQTEPLPDDYFPLLPKEYRSIYKLSFRIQWMKALAKGQTVWIKPPNEHPTSTILDWFHRAYFDPNGSRALSSQFLSRFQFAK